MDEALVNKTIQDATDKLVDFFKSVSNGDEDEFITCCYKAMGNILLSSTNGTYEEIEDHTEEFCDSFIDSVRSVILEKNPELADEEPNQIDLVVQGVDYLLEGISGFSCEHTFSENVQVASELLFINSITEDVITTDLVVKKLEEFTEGVLTRFYEASDNGVIVRSQDE